MAMWQPFTERARSAIVLAQEAAQHYRTSSIDPGHIFIGIVEAGESAAAQILLSFGAGPSRVRSAVQKRIKAAGLAAGDDFVFSLQAKRVIELAFEESRKLQHNYVGTEHLLLGYVRVASPSDSTLAELQIDPHRLEAKLLEFLEREPKTSVRGGDAPKAAQAESLASVFSEIERLDSPGLQSGIEHESQRRLYYVDTEDLWKRMQASVARRDVVGAMMYALFIQHRENRVADETIAEMRRRIRESYGNGAQ